MISVVVVTYNSRDVIVRCLESTRALAADGHEVVVVDNASPDGTAEFVRGEFPFCRVIEQATNEGFGRANNRGAALTTGDVMLLNPDAWLEDGCAEGLAEHLEEDPRLGQVSPRMLSATGESQFVWAPTTSIVGEALQILREKGPRALMDRPMGAFLRLFDGGWLTGGCTMVRREAWEEVGGFDEDFFLYFEDVDLSLRLRANGWRVGVDSSNAAFHLGGSSGIAEAHYRRSQFLYYRKHRPRWENRVLLSKQRRRFARQADPAVRSELLAIADEAEGALG